ncbi:MAG TPA: hypothetical protein VGG28_16000 [Kofleriaceae bacterium]|jgi:hypothetical protein
MASDVPRAVATGSAGNAALADRVSPRRAGIVAAVLAAGVAFAYWNVHAVPRQAIVAVGGAGEGIARYGGVVASWNPPSGFDLDQLAARFERHDMHAVLRRDGTAVRVDLPGIREHDAPDVIEMLDAGGLEFRPVIESTAAARLADLMMLKADAEPSLEIDSWRDEDSDARHTDDYLFAHDRATLEHTFAAAIAQGWSPPPDTEIVYERIEPSEGAKDRRVAWRSYFVTREVPLDGSSISEAVGSYDPNTNRPTVLLDFDRASTAKFGELTAKIVGHKLATIVGGVVKSAPIINGAIRGGRASISMGAGDPERMEHDRDVLVDVLRAGSLPIGGTISDAHWVAPSEHGRVIAARVLSSLLAGVLGFALAFVTIRVTRPARRTITPLPAGTGSRTWRRFAWTFGALLVYIAGTMVTAPGINGVEIDHLIRGNSLIEYANPFLLGVMPLVTAFVAIELVATVVPRWRPLRDTVLGRRKLGLAVAIAACATAIVQAYFVATYMAALRDVNVIPPGMFWLAVASLAAGPMVIAVLASIITTRGLGNGYGILIVAGWLWGPVVRRAGSASTSELAFAAVAIAAASIIALALASWRVRSPGRVAIPLPLAGKLPLYAGGGVIAVIAAVSAMHVELPIALEIKLRDLESARVAGAIVLVAATIVWSWVLARPGRRRNELAPELAPVDREGWLRAVGITIVALAALYALAMIGPLRDVTDPAIAIVVAAAIADAIADWRAHRTGELVAVWPLHDPLLVDAARDRLDAAGIPHHIQSTRLRSLLWIAGSYVPMMVLVPVDRAEAAHVLLRDWLSSPSSNG